MAGTSRHARRRTSGVGLVTLIGLFASMLVAAVPAAGAVGGLGATVGVVRAGPAEAGKVAKPMQRRSRLDKIGLGVDYVDKQTKMAPPSHRRDGIKRSASTRVPARRSDPRSPPSASTLWVARGRGGVPGDAGVPKAD
jgi:hypothetical protein